MNGYSSSSRRLRACLLLLLSSCWVYVPSPPISAVKAERSRPAASLIVDETGFPWAGGQLGSALARDLVTSGAFERIDYPVVPHGKPDVEIRVVARGLIDERQLWAEFASTFDVVFFLLPLPVTPYFEVWHCSADVRVDLGARGVLSVPVEDSIQVTHALFASPSRYQGRIQEIFVRRIQEDIVKALQGLAP
jgi:hypothetical protein